MSEPTSGAIALTVQFLKSVAPLMLRADLDTFEEVCRKLNDGTATMNDLVKIREIEEKFLKE
jgi:hypothetical protein